MSRISAQKHLRPHTASDVITAKPSSTTFGWLVKGVFSPPTASSDALNLSITSATITSGVAADAAAQTASSSAKHIAASEKSSRLHARCRDQLPQQQFRDHCEDDWRLRCAFKQCTTHPHFVRAHRFQPRLHATSTPDRCNQSHRERAQAWPSHRLECCSMFHMVSSQSKSQSVSVKVPHRHPSLPPALHRMIVMGSGWKESATTKKMHNSETRRTHVSGTA